MFNIKRFYFSWVTLTLFILFGAVNLLAQTAMVTNNFVYYPPKYLLPGTVYTTMPAHTSLNFQCTLPEIQYAYQVQHPSVSNFMPSSGQWGDFSFHDSNGVINGYNEQSFDPWVNSALIEFDEPFASSFTVSGTGTVYGNPYPNHCLTLCAEVTCSNPVRLIETTNSSGTATVTNTLASGDFPIQSILFDIFKYQAGSNPYNADTTPPIRTIAMYPAQGSDVDNICKGVPTCCNVPSSIGMDTKTSCNMYPEYTKSCCEACEWTYSASCSQRTGVCEGSAYLHNETACRAADGYCDWNGTSSCVNDSGNPCNDVPITQCGTGESANYCKKVGGEGTCNFNSYYTCDYEDCNSLDTPYCDWAPGSQTCVLVEDYCTRLDNNECTSSLYSDHCSWTYSSYTCEWKGDNVCATNFHDTQATCPDDFCTYTQGGTCSTKSASSSDCNGATQGNCNNPFCQWNTSDLTCHGNSNDDVNKCEGAQTGACKDVASKFPNKEACRAGITNLHFCTPWDGSYEIDGEFGKTNGQFGFRTTIKTNYPGDGISVTSDLNIEHMIAYPGDTQIPIRVDVTNVHSVRSSPTLVGTSPVVISAPYKLRYRLSKDATTTIDVIDPDLNPNAAPFPPGFSYIHRHLVNGQPRDGEGMQGGAQNDMVITNEDSWDGRDDQGRLLPYGNYMVSIQASTKDEWSGDQAEDLSRAVTRQLSLDPLKITDIVVTGLGKESTSYAKIDYMLTEAATVHFEIYTPGTTFEDLNICNGDSTVCTNGYMTNAGGLRGTPTVSSNTALTQPSGFRIASYREQKARRVTVNSKWDGMCWDEDNCGSVPGKPSTGTTNTGYAYGGAMPDGDYVYLLWAEIPYGSSSGSNGGAEFNAGDNTVIVNGVEWDGVKTHMIYNGIIPINRGFPEISIDAVSYSTIGSSPVANGLDPFVISYSLSRDSYIDAGIYTIASSGTYTAGVCEEQTPGSTITACAPYKVKTISDNEVKEALTRNVYYWDGLDDNGRYVSAGNYMLRITAQDALFPTKMVTRTIQFPVDMFRIVDVQTTPLLELGSSASLSGLASISYMLSKSMEATVKIYSTGTIIPTGGVDASGSPCVWPPQEQNSANTYCQGDPTCCIHDINSPLVDVFPIKEFKGTRQGEGYTITDYWDGYKVDGSSVATEMMPDGLYPYIIVASASLPGSLYYSTDMADGIVYPLNGAWHPLDAMIASDKVTGYITVSRGPVYFTDINIRATHPTQYYSSATVELAPYEIEFSVNRVSSVTVEIISTVDGACYDENGLNTAGVTCRTLTRTNFVSGLLQDYNVYDADVLNTLYWDGKDAKGNYVKIANYQVKFTAVPYLSNGVSDPGLNITVENRNLVVNNFQVFDRYIWDVATQNKNQGKFAYQISVPMKTAIQIFKPETRVIEYSSGTLSNPIQGYGNVYSTDTRDVLVKSIVGVRPNLVSLEEIWDGTDYAGQKVPDGIYPFRFVTVLNSYQMNSITGDPIVDIAGGELVSDVVMDWDKYVNMSVINVVNGDSWYADIDWKDPKVTMFYPNPLREQEGFFEITKVPAPGKVTIKIYNIAGDLVRDRGYECVNAIGTTALLEDLNDMGTYGAITPDWNSGGYSNPAATGVDSGLLGSHALGRNFAMRCKWDRKNNAGKSVARGLYYAIMTLDPTRGNAKKSQRVIKILIP